MNAEGPAPAPLARARLWWQGSQRLRFLVVGAWNTLFGYGCFALLYLLFGRHVHYMVLQVIAHFLSVTNAFIWHRHVTFRSRATWPLEFARFNASYLGTLALGLVTLPLLVRGLAISPLLGAALVTVLTVATSYALHRRFSFRS
ncbi:MAG TPA: GtrA family protein [Steroidobacteraceae bacterium]|nr:GtrA family protein [Steroidobacteraceae bacterium]